ncbi:AAA family ATPase [Dolichospermum sp. ST_sed3]|nr:AAA family ATPase [Dolichospermum sp. ST_sed3]
MANYRAAMIMAMKNSEDLSWKSEGTIPIELLPGKRLGYLPEILQNSSDRQPMVDKSWRQLTQLFAAEADKLYQMGALTVLMSSSGMEKGFESLLESPEFKAKMDHLESANRVLIKGYAGSGKTQLLLQSVARLCQDSDERVLVLCYNDLLAEWLGEQLSYLKCALVFSFHGFCQFLAEQIDPDYAQVPDKEKNTYFKETLPWIVETAIKEGSISVPEFGAIFIDEVQDLERSWLQIIQTFAQPGTRWICNMDPSQQWQKDVDYGNDKIQITDEFWQNFQLIELCNNLRNPKNVRNAALEHLKVIEVNPHGRFKEHPFANVREGIKRVQSVELSNLPIVVKKLLDELLGENALSPDQVVILSDRSHDSLYLTEFLIRYGQMIGSYRLAEASGDGCIRLDTIRRFKGLEAEVVIAVYEKFEPGTLKSERLGYLAATRAKGGYFALQVQK